MRRVSDLAGGYDVFGYFKHQETSVEAPCLRVVRRSQVSLATFCRVPPLAVRRSFPPSRACPGSGKQSCVPVRSSRAISPSSPTAPPTRRSPDSCLPSRAIRIARRSSRSTAQPCTPRPSPAPSLLRTGSVPKHRRPARDCSAAPLARVQPAAGIEGNSTVLLRLPFASPGRVASLRNIDPGLWYRCNSTAKSTCSKALINQGLRKAVPADKSLKGTFLPVLHTRWKSFADLYLRLPRLSTPYLAIRRAIPPSLVRLSVDPKLHNSHLWQSLASPLVLPRPGLRTSPALQSCAPW